MNKSKIIFSMVLAIVFLAVQVIVAGAAPLAQDETPSASQIVDITWETNPDTTETVVVVTYTDAEGVSQTVYLSVEEATELDLITVDESGNLVKNNEAIGQPFDGSTTTDGEEGVTEEEKLHPVGSALSDFFSDLLGVDYDTVMTYHDEGVGFGTIAQALWMTNALGGDTTTFALILDAKQNNDYSLITLPDGSIPKNWGQFRNAILKDQDKAKENLGAVKSGRAGNQEGDTLPGKGNGKKPDKENGNKNNTIDGNGETGTGINGNSNKDQTGLGAGNDKNKENDRGNSNKEKGDKEKGKKK